jgi:hypothetical protein
MIKVTEEDRQELYARMDIANKCGAPFLFDVLKKGKERIIRDTEKQEVLYSKDFKIENIYQKESYEDFKKKLDQLLKDGWSLF